jgi:serine/threonine protein kinase
MNNSETEFKVSRRLQGHPNIVQIYSYDKQQPILIEGHLAKRDFMRLELCKNGDLFDFMRRYTDFKTKSGHHIKGLLIDDMPLLRSMFYQLIQAVSSLHNEAGYAHMDIKLENILISNEGLLKLCDFGLSTETNSQICRILGTQSYMAPEILTSTKQPCNAKLTDIFSLGVLFYILAFGAPPFHTAQLSDVYFKFLHKKPGSLDFFKFHPHTKVLFKNGMLSQSLQNMLIRMLSPDPRDRLQDVKELLENDFITGKFQLGGVDHSNPLLHYEVAGSNLLQRYEFIKQSL